MHSNSERGGVVGAILLVLGSLVLVVMVALVGAGLYFAHHVHVSTAEGAHGGTVNVETPFGSVHVREDSKLDPKSFGVPVYPGAVLDTDHHKLASVELNFGDDDSRHLAVVTGEYTTSDPIEKVREYYRGELPHWLISNERHGRVHFSFTEGGHKKIVVIEDRHGRTRIVLVSIGEPAAN